MSDYDAALAALDPRPGDADVYLSPARLKEALRLLGQQAAHGGFPRAASTADLPSQPAPGLAFLVGGELFVSTVAGWSRIGSAAVCDVPQEGDAGPGQVVKGDDARLSDSRNPLAHRSSHRAGGSDPLTPDDIGAASKAYADEIAASVGMAVGEVQDVREDSQATANIVGSLGVDLHNTKQRVSSIETDMTQLVTADRDLLNAVGAVAAEVTAVDQRVTDTNAVVSQVASMHPVGDGSPLGKVVPQFVGQQYTDRLATCGAVVWVATGTTAASWTVLHGDTGWRDITGLLTIGANWTVTTVRVRRTAAGVWYRVKATASTGATTMFATAGVPSGWYQPDSQIRQMLNGAHSGNGQIAVEIGYTGTMRIMGGNPSAGITYDVLDMIHAPSAWPTALPGTLSIEEDADADLADAAGGPAAPDRGEA